MTKQQIQNDLARIRSQVGIIMNHATKRAREMEIKNIQRMINDLSNGISMGGIE